MRPRPGPAQRREHSRRALVVAKRQGRTAPRNILGCRERFDAVPFFWSQHYDVALSYVRHDARWDATKIEGSLADRDGKLTFLQGDRPLAIATIFRDCDSLVAEVEMERRAAPR